MITIKRFTNNWHAQVFMPQRRVKTRYKSLTYSINMSVHLKRNNPLPIINSPRVQQSRKFYQHQRDYYPIKYHLHINIKQQSYFLLYIESKESPCSVDIGYNSQYEVKVIIYKPQNEETNHFYNQNVNEAYAKYQQLQGNNHKYQALLSCSLKKISHNCEKTNLLILEERKTKKNT